jgi:long-chain acyl-CoA synthetase
LLLHPLRTVVIDDFRRWRGIALYTGAVVLSRRLQQRTDRPNIGIMLPTSGLFPMALLATWLIGRTGVSVNYLLRKPELAYVLGDSEVELVITVSQMLEQFGELPEGVEPLLLDEMAFPKLPRFRRAARSAPEKTVLLLYTSGTSGKPKGVELTESALAANVWQCARWGSVTRRDVILSVLPQFHSFGLTVLTLLPLRKGARVVYTVRFVPRRMLELARQHRPTCFVGIPAMYRALLNERGARPDDFASARLLVSGADALPADVRDAFRERFGATINEGYGLTETGPALNAVPPGQDAPRSVGPPLPLVEERIVAEDGTVLPPGAEGEICARGPNLMKRYYKLPLATAAVFDGDGFFHTGDLGHLDEQGRLYITGRISDLIIVGGENVFPREIEDILNRHDAVKDSAVVGIRDESRGEAPVAFIELMPGAALEERGLRAHCRQSLAAYKVPRRIVAVDELPRTATGKVMRHLLPVDLADAPQHLGVGHESEDDSD